MVGTAAGRLKERLDLIYGKQTDAHARTFSVLHLTVLPLCASARSIFQQLRNSTTLKASKRRVDTGAACKVNGRPNGRITGVDMRHLLLLLPFLLFDLLHDELSVYNTDNHSDHPNPADDLIGWVLVLLEWYRLYRWYSSMQYNVM